MTRFFAGPTHLMTPIGACLLLASGWTSEPVAAEPGPLGTPGDHALYLLAEAEASLARRPDWERQQKRSVVAAELRLGPVEPGGANGREQWCSLTWWRVNGQRYQLWLLLDRWPQPNVAPRVSGYRWLEPDWPAALSYRHASGGQLLLPRLSLWRYGWPQTDADPDPAGRDLPVAGFPERFWLHGWLFDRQPDDGAAVGSWGERLRPLGLASDDLHPSLVSPPSQVTTVRLQPDLLIGWTPMDRDAAGRPYHRLPDQSYRYVPKTDEDLTADRDSGANFFVAHPRRGDDTLPAWLTRSPMFNNTLARRPADWPADLYRPNYWGFGNHIDEPGVGNWGLSLDTGPDADVPEMQAVASLQRAVRRGVEGRGQSGIERHLAKRFGLGEMRLQEGPESIVSWEYEWPTAWYQLAVPDGVGGIVDEDVTTNDLVESYNMAFGTEIPPTVENAVALRVAVLRGAARNFRKRWGVAFYHPNEVKLKATTIPLLYRKGASYFWAWSGWVGITDNSGLPYPYQRYYNSLVRTAYQANPDRDVDALTRAATVAIVLPNGYTFTPYHMHRLPWLHLEKRNRDGVRYRQVLSHAAHEAERLLRQGIDFDIAIDEPLFRAKGYQELIYAQADGRLRIERPGEPPRWLDGPRPVRRPDLGPGPRLWLERLEPDDQEPGEIRFRAVGRLGTGDWAGERPHARVTWEIYGPDGLVSPAIFPEEGAVRSLRLDPEARAHLPHPIPEEFRSRSRPGPEPAAGSYTLRAALADVFGRPAIAYQTVEVE